MFYSVSNTDPLFESSQLIPGKSVSLAWEEAISGNVILSFLTNHRDNVNLAAESLHELNIQGFKTMTRRGNEVEASMHSAKKIVELRYA